MLAPYPDRLRSSRSTPAPSNPNANPNANPASTPGSTQTPPPPPSLSTTSASHHKLFSSRSSTRMRTNSLSSPSPPAIAHIDSLSSSTDVSSRTFRNSSRRPAVNRRPSTSSGVPDQKHQPLVPIVVPTSAAIPPLSDFIPTRRKSTKRPPARNESVASTQLSRSSSSATATPVEPAKSDARFSTADRAILEELKLGAAARKSQFKMKGNKKHHAYPKSEAPYPRNYERAVIDHDVWETGFIRQLSGSQTFHVFATPPTKVLDLGCGSGYWILECAKLWRNCEFVGLDLVPLHPDLSHLGSSDLGSRITWVQANCLDGLPFPNEEFDFVHIKRIAHGIPEDKWDFLLEEISRVMKPGAAIEMIEEDMFFPGRSPDPPSPSRSSTPVPCIATSTHHPSDGKYHDLNEQQNFSQFESAVTLTDTTIGPVIYPPRLSSTIGTTNTLTIPTSIRSTDNINSPGNSDLLYSDSLRPAPGAPLNPRDHSLLEYIYTEMHASRFINLSPLSLLANSLPLYFKHVRSHAPIMFMFPPPDLTGVKQQLSRSTDERGVSESTSRSIQRSHTVSGKSTSATLIGGRQILDHSQHYVVLDESAVGPGTTVARQKASSISSGTTTTAGLPTLATFPRFSALVSPESPPLSEKRLTNAGPTPSSQIAGDDVDAASRLNTLPNQRLKFDLQSLNLHLSTRVTEILACAEAMWGWICEYQRSPPGQQPHIHKEHCQSRNAHPERGGTHKFSAELIGMSRAELDVLLTRFELDMRDCIRIESRITSAFHAPAPALALTNDRKAFNNACEKWEEYQNKQRERHKTRLTGAPVKEGTDRSLESDDGEAAVSTEQRLSRTIRVFCAWKASECA